MWSPVKTVKDETHHILMAFPKIMSHESVYTVWNILRSVLRHFEERYRDAILAYEEREEVRLQQEFEAAMASEEEGRFLDESRRGSWCSASGYEGEI